MIRFALAAALVLGLPAVTPAAAQDAQVARDGPDAQAATGQPPQRIRDVSVAKGQPCPRSTGTEVVVCHTLDDPYRIPRTLRDDHPVAAANQSWVNRTAMMDSVGREAGGLPDTCSPVGTGGQSGCALQQNQAYAAERRATTASGGQ